MTDLGLTLPIGSFPPGLDLGAMARLAEETGAASLWVPDHIVQVDDIRSAHPFSEGGRARWPADSPWLEVMSTIAWLAASTERVRVGSNVMVLPQRDPILTAKTAATIDTLSGGRLALGIGAGWMREEFEILGWDFASRGRRMEEAMDVMRRLWQGSPDAFEGEFFTLPDGVQAYPTPVQAGGVPLYVGGMSDLAIRRAARVGDGWFALVRIAPMNDDELAGVADQLRAQLATAAAARPAGAPPMRNLLGLGLIEERHLPLLPELAALGFDEIVVNTHWTDRGAFAEHVGAALAALA